MEPPSRSPEQYVVKTVGALPLLRGLLKRVGLAEVLDRVLPKDPQAYLSVGEVAEMLVANRLSSPRPLYRVEEWAERAGVAQVFGFRPDWLNDDRLGRTLDRLGENAKALKGELCLELARRFGVELKRFHYDLTTVWLEGEYENEPPGSIRIQYTKDSKWEPAGKGFRVAVSTFDDGRGEVSLAYQPLDGTEATNTAAVKNLKELRKVLGKGVDRVLQVSDRAGVTPEVVATADLEGFTVLGPLIMNAALGRKVRELLGKGPAWQQMSYVSGREARKPAEQQDRYQAFEVPYSFTHEGVEYPARLIVVASDGKRKRDQKSRQKHQQRIEQHLAEVQGKAGSARGRKGDLRRKVQEILDRYREGKFYEVTWHGPTERPTGLAWHVVQERVTHAEQMEGIYAAATTLPSEKHPLDAVFTQLKQQWRVEGSHRILKGPLRISPVFLHHAKRIEGLIFVLWMALVVYQLLEREWRQKAPDAKMSRWTTQILFRLFEGYSYVGVQQAEQVRWVTCVVPTLHRLVYRTLDLRGPDTS